MGAGGTVVMQSVNKATANPQLGVHGCRHIGSGSTIAGTHFVGPAQQRRGCGHASRHSVRLSVDGCPDLGVHVVAKPPGRWPVHNAVQVRAGTATQIRDQPRRGTVVRQVPQHVLGGVTQLPKSSSGSWVSPECR